MNDYSGWLAHAADDLNPIQRATFEGFADTYYAQPHIAKRDPEDYLANTAEDDAALTAILQHLLGEGSLMTAAREYRQAEAALYGWIRAMDAVGMSEVQIAEQSSLSRPTVRKRLGK